MLEIAVMWIDISQCTILSITIVFCQDITRKKEMWVEYGEKGRGQKTSENQQNPEITECFEIRIAIEE